MADTDLSTMNRTVYYAAAIFQAAAALPDEFLPTVSLEWNGKDGISGVGLKVEYDPKSRKPLPTVAQLIEANVSSYIGACWAVECLYFDGKESARALQQEILMRDHLQALFTQKDLFIDTVQADIVVENMKANSLKILGEKNTFFKWVGELEREVQSVIKGNNPITPTLQQSPPSLPPQSPSP